MKRKIRIGIARNLFDKEGKFSVPGPGLELIDEIGNAEWEMIPEALPQITAEQLQGFDMAVFPLSKLTREGLTGNDQLISFHCNSVGFDLVDVTALTEAGVVLCNTPKAVRRPMASSIIAFILALSLRLLQKDKMAREGRWSEKTPYFGVGLTGKTLGSIGVGGIGHDMFRLAKPFGMRHVAFDPYVNQNDLADVEVDLVDLDTLLSESDFLNVSCPLNEATYHLIGENEFRKMKKTAYFINTSRGSVIDEPALTKALQEKWISGAAIDVFEQEPTPDDNPLLKLDNIIVAPHYIGGTDEMSTDKWEENINQIRSLIKGEAPGAFVNREVWDKPYFQAKLKKFHEVVR